MEIRTDSKYYQKLKKQKTSSCKDIKITLQEDTKTPVLMSRNNENQLVSILVGYKPVKNFLKYGYNRIIKKCPCRIGKCIGEKCQWYFIKGITGDCSMIWRLFKR